MVCTCYVIIVFGWDGIIDRRVIGEKNSICFLETKGDKFEFFYKRLRWGNGFLIDLWCSCRERCGIYFVIDWIGEARGKVLHIF